MGTNEEDLWPGYLKTPSMIVVRDRKAIGSTDSVSEAKIVRDGISPFEMEVADDVNTAELASDETSPYYAVDLYMDVHLHALHEFTGEDLLTFFDEHEAVGDDAMEVDKIPANEHESLPQYIEAWMDRIRDYCLKNATAGTDSWVKMLKERGYPISKSILQNMLQRGTSGNRRRMMPLHLREQHLQGVISWLNEREE
ncbi:unnamed protein product, partial [Mesorhabditis spiculigera]